MKKIQNKTVYFSDILPKEHFFTTREIEIKDNVELICDYLSINKLDLIKPCQIHSDNIEIVDSRSNYPDCDSLILKEKNKAIYLNFADCTPIILYDEKQDIVAIAHAGWRGTALKIAPKTVIKMKSNPKDIIALIGPCISFEYFETSTDAIEQLKNTVKKQDGLFKNNYADLKQINKRQLEEIGVEKFDISSFCTIKDNDKFFSYRKENKTTKRYSALIKL